MQSDFVTMHSPTLPYYYIHSHIHKLCLDRGRAMLAAPSIMQKGISVPFLQCGRMIASTAIASTA